MPRNATGGKLVSPLSTGMIDLVTGRWQGGDSGNCTRLEGQGISSVAIGTTGQYTIQLAGRFTSLLSHCLQIGGTDGTANDTKVVNPKEYNATAGTLTFSVNDQQGTPTLANIAAAEWVSITLFLRCQGDVGQ